MESALQFCTRFGFIIKMARIDPVTPTCVYKIAITRHDCPMDLHMSGAAHQAHFLDLELLLERDEPDLLPFFFFLRPPFKARVKSCKGRLYRHGASIEIFLGAVRTLARLRMTVCVRG
mmetsp:Transcript_40951/g.97639  ORF Transcript_40951/g.97639 Transcript_40951/m.97639 type:complete len:118 (-) Transcript_40951:2657-3010(-)